MSGWTIPFVFLIMGGIAFGLWFAAPKGPNQTLIRTMTSLTITACTIMWAVTYLAQLHPLVAPRNSRLRPEAEDYSL